MLHPFYIIYAPCAPVAQGFIDEGGDLAARRVAPGTRDERTGAGTLLGRGCELLEEDFPGAFLPVAGRHQPLAIVLTVCAAGRCALFRLDTRRSMCHSLGDLRI